jgi:oxygen-independent coproporphyrinogen-3 oxidase
MTSLRTSEGISLATIEELSEDVTAAQILAEALKFIDQNLMAVDGSALFLTRKGKLFADGIASELFRI